MTQRVILLKIYYSNWSELCCVGHSFYFKYPVWPRQNKSTRDLCKVFDCCRRCYCQCLALLANSIGLCHLFTHNCTKLGHLPQLIESSFSLSSSLLCQWKHCEQFDIHSSCLFVVHCSFSLYNSTRHSLIISCFTRHCILSCFFLCKCLSLLAFTLTWIIIASPSSPSSPSALSVFSYLKAYYSQCFWLTHCAAKISSGIDHPACRYRNMDPVLFNEKHLIEHQIMVEAYDHLLHYRCQVAVQVIHTRRDLCPPFLGKSNRSQR